MSQRGPDGSSSSSSKILLDALKTELHFYRDFFWRYQDALRAAVVGDADLAEILRGTLSASLAGAPVQPDVDDETSENSAPPNRRPFALAYGLQLAEARCRNLDEEACTLHEHFRSRLSDLESTLQQERHQRAQVLQENIQLREANHALCREVRRLRDGCADLLSVHVVRLQQIYLIVDESLWRARIESEALRYLTLRAVDTPEIGLACVASTGVIASSSSTPPSAKERAVSLTTGKSPSSSSNPGMASSLNALLSSTASRNRLSTAVSFVFDKYYPSTRLAARDWVQMASLCEDQFEFVTRELQRRMRALAFPDTLTDVQGALLGDAAGRPQHGAVRRATTGTRRGLTEDDERLIRLCLAAYDGDAQHVQPTPVPRQQLVNRSGSLVADVTRNATTRSLPAEAPTSVESPPLLEESSPLQREHDDGVVSPPQQPTAVGVDQSPLSYHQEATKRRALDLVGKFHDPLRAVRNPSTADAFVFSDAQNDAKRGESSIEAFIHQRAQRLVAVGDESFIGGRVPTSHSPSLMVAACSALDPLVRTQQQLRSSVLQLQRERDDALHHSAELERRLAEARSATSQSRQKVVDDALQRLSLWETEQHQLETPPSPPPVVGASTTTRVALPHAESRGDHASRIAALPSQVVDRIALAASDMKNFETIARKSQDPSLRGRMMRQMKELHQEVAALMHH